VCVFVRDTQTDSITKACNTETARKVLPNFMAKNSCRGAGVAHMVSMYLFVVGSAV
jgi:hypothetical protein